jgi:beta-N-acetylhexosaminidase
LLLTLALSTSTAIVVAQEDQVFEPAVEEIFSRLTPEQRVGQLFMVSFQGDEVGSGSDIAELIQDYYIGGVVLSADKQNFVNGPDTPAQVLTLTNALQMLAQEPPEPVVITPTLTLTSPITTTELTPTITITPTVLPLYIAINHEGNGFPYTQIRDGLTEIPNQMALGATWNPQNAQVIGQTVGRELSLLGVNMLFGPSLDVLDNPRPDRGGSLGVRTFGGDPFWVGKLGQAYVQGVHLGSDSQVLTIAKHFPGFGSSDRQINQGVPTILKSLDDLRQTELPPFFKVTRINPDAPDNTTSLVDGLMTAHVRYQGLQGNVPISLDARNLPAILALKEFAPWREAGGLVVSAPLGAPAALEGIAAPNDTFPGRRLAQDAFLAGSDVLLLQDFSFAAAPENEMDNIKNAITFFREKYASDPNFQAAVDKAVRRTIKAKMKIYGEDLATADPLKPKENLTLLQEIAPDIAQIAQAGVTLITPIRQEGSTPLPEPPRPGQNILIFTDDRQVQDCGDCAEFSLIETNSLQDIILQLFGPDATDQILPEQVASLGFGDLNAVLSEEPPEGSEEIEAQIQNADWIIFAMLDIDPQTQPQSDAVRVLLRERYDLLRNKNLILFAFDAPYFLDETEISQLTAYYGFYSRGRDYLEAAARLLFQQFVPIGASPVRIPALGPLDLSPNPRQLIQLTPMQKIDKEGAVTILDEQPEPITTMDLSVGEGILFRTSIIVDKNGHPVPDGTPVDFFRFYPLEGLSLEPQRTTTTDGVAQITIVKERDTPLQVSASSDLATESVTFNIGPGIVDTPTPTVTSTPLPTDTPTFTPSPIPEEVVENTPTLTPTPTPTPLPPESPLPPPVSFVDLVYALIGMMVIGGIAFTLGGDRFSLEERIRPALMAVAMGLVGYIGYTILAMMYPEGDLVMRGATGHWVAPLVSLIFAIGGGMAWFFKPGRIFWVQDVERLKKWFYQTWLGAYFADGGLLAGFKGTAGNTGGEGQNDGQDQQGSNERQ